MVFVTTLQKSGLMSCKIVVWEVGTIFYDFVCVDSSQPRNPGELEVEVEKKMTTGASKCNLRIVSLPSAPHTGLRNKCLPNGTAPAALPNKCLPIGTAAAGSSIQHEG